MNDNTTRALLVAGLCANVLFLTLALLDNAAWRSQYLWPIFVGWGVLIVLLVALALVAGGIRLAVVREAPPSKLTRRELEVLTLMAGGLHNREIAERLSLSVGTVRNHLNAVSRKTEARNRIDAIRIARESGWL